MRIVALLLLGYPWLSAPDPAQSLDRRIAPPEWTFARGERRRFKATRADRAAR